MIRAGDVVRHEASGETWTVGCADDKQIAPAGWPPCTVPVEAVTLIEACTDADHVWMAGHEWRSGDARRQLAMAHRCPVCRRARLESAIAQVTALVWGATVHGPETPDPETRDLIARHQALVLAGTPDPQVEQELRDRLEPQRTEAARLMAVVRAAQRWMSIRAAFDAAAPDRHADMDDDDVESVLAAWVHLDARRRHADTDR